VAEIERRELANGLGRTEPVLAGCHKRDFGLRKIRPHLGLERGKNIPGGFSSASITTQLLLCMYIVLIYILKNKTSIMFYLGGTFGLAKVL